MGNAQMCSVSDDCFRVFGLIGGEYYEVNVIGPGREGMQNVLVYVLEGPYKDKRGYIETFRLLFQDGLFTRNSPKGEGVSG